MKSIEKITVVGSGIMGAGIAASIFKYGFEVKLFDTDMEKLEKACSEIKQKARRKMDPEKIKISRTMEDAVKDADLIIEAIFEDLDVKCELFNKLGEIAPEETIFASNTSSLSISSMAKASGRPDRFVGLHFFNPTVIMRLVEIIIPQSLNKENLKKVGEFILNIKKVGVKCKESPGFVVNRILLPVINESFYMAEELIRNTIREELKLGQLNSESWKKILELINDIDSAILKEEILLMGPFDLVDLTGIDTIYHVAKVIYEGFNKSSRYTPCPLLKQYMDNKLLGRKVERGMYWYGNKSNDPDINPCLDEKHQPIKRIDNPGFKAIKFIAAVVNEAFRVIEEGIVEDFNDIELSMELGARWLKSPFLLAKETGLDLILKTLKNRYEESGNNPRYEPSKLFNALTPELEKFFV